MWEMCHATIDIFLTTPRHALACLEISCQPEVFGVSYDLLTITEDYFIAIVVVHD